MEASSIAKNMLLTKGLIASRSIFEKLAEMPNAPILPGFPPYLPDQWTLERSKQIIFDIVKKWVSYNNGDSNKQEKFEPFCRFAIRRMSELERVYRAKMRKDGMNLSQLESTPLSNIFNNSRLLSATIGMKEFIIASFTVSFMVKTNSTTSEYLTWFIEDYTPKLNELWKKNKDK